MLRPRNVPHYYMYNSSITPTRTSVLRRRVLDQTESEFLPKAAHEITYKISVLPPSSTAANSRCSITNLLLTVNKILYYILCAALEISHIACVSKSIQWSSFVTVITPKHGYNIIVVPSRDKPSSNLRNVFEYCIHYYVLTRTHTRQH